MKKLLFIYYILGLVLYSNHVFADQWDYKNYVSVDVIKGSYHNNSLLGVRFSLEKGWKIYNNQEQEVGFPTSFNVDNSRNLKDFGVSFPKAKRFVEYDKFVNYGYEGEVIFPVQLVPLNREKNISSDILINFALCKDICIAVNEVLTFDIEKGYFSEENVSMINEYREINVVLISILFAAVIAGFILNFMPCVLPVLLLKVVSFLEKRTKDRRVVVISSLSTIAGIIFTFILLSILVMLLKLLGYNLGWGLHFQEPLFIGFLVIILIVFASSIMGYVSINVPNFIIKRLDNLGKDNNFILHHFFTGVLATLLATPCSAPFLGPVISFALTTNYLNVFLIFISIGIGLSVPYILLIIAPKLLYLLPKPGKWMEKLKELMAIFLIITALWLLKVIYGQIGVFGVSIFFMEIVILFKMIKLHKQIIPFIGPVFYRLLLVINILLCVFVIHSFKDSYITNNKNDNWVDFHSVEIAELLQTHQGVFVNVTADWCITCKANELFILNSKKLRDSFEKNDIVMVKADYTSPDIKIRNYLASFDRYAVPTYVLYNKKYRQGKLLSEINSVNFLIRAVSRE